MDTNEDRTHGEHSAINDEIAARVPNDMPNAEHKDGDAQLTYDFQTFNALVAANTALQTEVSGAAERANELQAHIATLRDTNANIRSETERRFQEHKEQLKERDNEIDALRGDLNYERDRATEFQRKLDRQSGYLDRVFDQEDSYDAAKTQTVPAPAPAIGPNFDDIPRAIRRARNSDSDFSGYVTDIASARLDVGFGSTARPRRS